MLATMQAARPTVSKGTSQGVIGPTITAPAPATATNQITAPVTPLLVLGMCSSALPVDRWFVSRTG